MIKKRLIIKMKSKYKFWTKEQLKFLLEGGYRGFKPKLRGSSISIDNSGFVIHGGVRFALGGGSDW